MKTTDKNHELGTLQTLVLSMHAAIPANLNSKTCAPIPGGCVGFLEGSVTTQDMRYFYTSLR